jgi:hypothetical protein
MPRPIVNGRTSTGLPAARTTPRTGRQRLLSTPRSRAYLDAIRSLDPSAQVSRVNVDDIVDRIRKEFADKWASTPLGIVGKCYLGEPYEVHTLTLDGSILAHYRTGEALPGPLERARGIAQTEAYLAIEVYPDRLLYLRTDGSVIVSGSES